MISFEVKLSWLDSHSPFDPAGVVGGHAVDAPFEVFLEGVEDAVEVGGGVGLHGLGALGDVLLEQGHEGADEVVAGAAVAFFVALAVVEAPEGGEGFRSSTGTGRGGPTGLRRRRGCRGSPGWRGSRRGGRSGRR